MFYPYRPTARTCSSLGGKRKQAIGREVAVGSKGFWRRAEEDPGWIAVVDPDGTQHRAGDLLSRANQLTHALRARGLQPGDGIASMLPNGAPR